MNIGRVVLIGVIAIVLLSVVPMAMSSGQVKGSGNRNILKIAMLGDMPNFNYFDLGSNTVWKKDVIGWNFEGLMGMDYDGSAYPLLAESVNFDENTFTATIYLRHNITFHDGVAMTAKDIIFSYCTLRMDTTVSGDKFLVPFDDNEDGIVSFSEIQYHVRYVDDYTVKISSRQPYNYFFLGTLGIPIISEHIWKDHLVDVDGQGTSVDSQGYTHGIVDTSWGDDPNATIGTGPWMYGGGEKNSYRIEKPYEGYWGKDFKTPDGYPLWNSHISEMDFKIYSKMNTAVLALEVGEVDYIAGTIEPDEVHVLEKHPDITLHFLPDRGYTYLAFNEKTEPANYIAFRHAVSHVIDKANIVENYLEGFGQEGDSTEPPFFTGWYNNSVQHYTYNLYTAKKILDDAEKVIAYNGFVEQDPAWGEKFVDVDGDGWRDLPNGFPMKPINILTPPMDYDPVRVKVGGQITMNLRNIGVNAQVKPVDFDTLLSYMGSYNYQMLILDWKLGADPVGNIADIYHPHSILNTWGWWNASDPNSYYFNAGGVKNTKADKISQDFATQFDNVINQAIPTFNVTRQIKYTKWAQDIIAKATVVNVLYYRLNIEASRDSWLGWVEWQGSIFNWLSLGRIHPNTPHFSIKKLNAWIDSPNEVKVGNTAYAKVVVVNNVGNEIKDAYVELSVDNSNIQVSPTSGYTDSNGEFKFTIQGNAEGFTRIRANVSYGGLKAYSNITVEAVDLNVLSLSVTADKYSLNPGDSVNIYAKVVDKNGNPVSDANVAVDTELLGYGSISPSNGTTDSNGIAKFTYTAPSSSDMSNKYIDMHTIANLVFHADKEGYDFANTVTLRIITYNNNPSHWDIVRVMEVSNWTVNSTSLTTGIHLLAQDVDGTPLSNKDIFITYSNESYLSNPPQKITTDTHGWANFTLTFKADLPTNTVKIDFYIPSEHSISDSIIILYWNGLVPYPLYGGLIKVSDIYLRGNSSFTVYLYNKTNQPAASVPLSIVVSATYDGQLVNLDDETNNYGKYFNSLWNHTGIEIYTPQNTIFTSGEFVGNDTTGWTGVVPAILHNGICRINLTLASMSYRDLAFDIFAIPYGNISTQYIPGSWCYNISGNEYLHTQAVVGRAMNIEIANISANPVAISGEKFTLSVAVYNQTNSPVSGAIVNVYSNEFSAVQGRTDVNGVITLEPRAPHFSIPSEINIYVNTTANATTYSVLESTQIAVKPNETYINADFNGNVLWNKTHLIINATLLNNESQPLSGKNVTVMIENDTYWNFTSSDGATEFNISLEKYHGIVPVYVEFGEGGYRYSVYTFYIFTTGGDINFTDLNYPNYVVLNSNGNITVRVNSTFDLQWVVIYIKSPSSSNPQGHVMSRVDSTNVYYYNTTYDEEGSYEFYIEAVDIHNYATVTPQHTIQASSQIPELPLLPLYLIMLFAIIAFIQRWYSLLSIEREKKSF